MATSKSTVDNGVYVVNSMTYDYSSQRGESYKGRKSMTLPNQSLSVPQIIKRYATGIDMNIMKRGVFNGDKTLIPDPKTLDLVDVRKIQREVSKKLNERTEAIVKVRKKRKQDEHNKLVSDEAARLAAEIANGTNIP